jgi:hypothetical protein
MLKVSAVTLAIGWAILLQIHLTGNLARSLTIHDESASRVGFILASGQTRRMKGATH